MFKSMALNSVLVEVGRLENATKKQNDLKMLHKKGCLIFGMLNSNYMKKLVILLCLIDASLFGSSQFLYTGVIAKYDFFGNSNDSSGNNLHASNQGAVMSQDRFQNGNSAYSFNGQNNYLVVDDNALLKPNVFSVSLWIKADQWNNIPNSSPYVDIFTKDKNSVTPNERQYVIQAVSSGVIKSTVQTTGQENSGYTVNGGPSGDGSLSLGEWHQIVSVWDSKSMNIYLNGENAYTFDFLNQSQDLNTGASPLRIGGSPEWDQYFKGSIDDVRIFDYALSSSDVSSLYATESVPEPSALSLLAVGLGGLAMFRRRS
jgi:hypothetical protein